MATSAKLTHSTDEVRFSSLLQGEKIYSIPYFQRPYKWQPAKLRQLEADVLNLVDGQSEVHFLGAIISYDQPKSNSAQASLIDVIDGQQRLTTIFLYICGVVRVLIDLGRLEEAKRLFNKFVVIPDGVDSGSNLRLHTSHEDRMALNVVIDDILQNDDFSALLIGFTFLRLKASDTPDASAGKSIKNNYTAAKRFFKSQHDQGGLQRVQQVYEAFLSGLTVVQIVVQDPTIGPKIFDSLNSRQEPMTTGDLIRNDIFARVSEKDSHLVENLHQNMWLPFYKKFKVGKKNYFDDYFFPYGLTQDSKLTKSSVYSALTTAWHGKSPEDVIKELASYQAYFMDLVAGTNTADQSAPVAKRIRRLHEANAPSSVFPFVMSLAKAAKDDSDMEGSIIAVLDLLDSFLTRRQLCAIEPTGLHAVFKSLWSDLDDEITTKNVLSKMLRHSTVKWPGDELVRESIPKRRVYGSSIASYLIREYDRHQGGDPHSTIAQVEHVLPQKPKWADWPSFTKEQHANICDHFANLLPLSTSMNPSLSNGSYATKRDVYESDSVFKSTRKFAKTYSDWTPDAFASREALLIEWILVRWPDPRT